MVLINGRKFACEACIRGHRASSCAHTGRQLQLVRPKGRPSSQCDICRAKRANGSFHGRCDCEADTEEGKVRKGKVEVQVETFTPYAEEITSNHASGVSLVDDEARINADAAKGRHSLQSLMNPCQCRTTGICSCCSRTSSLPNEVNAISKASVEEPASCGCNGGDTCCDDGLNSCDDAQHPENTEAPITLPKASCCGTKKKEVVTQPLTSLHPFPDLFTEEQMAVLSPECQCGPTCSCPGCLNENPEAKPDDEDDCPDKCLTCSACALGLTRPSGIEAVDEWMAREKKESKEVQTTAQEPQREKDNEEEYRASKRPKLETGVQTSAVLPLPPPNLPPFAQAQTFFQQHFEDPDKRRYFREHLAAAQSSRSTQGSTSTRSTARAAFGERRPGESDEEWKLRHGFRFLTPEAIRIFDHAKRFREEKQRLDDKEEEEHASVASDVSAASKELALLRAKALSGRRSVQSTAKTAT